MESSWELYREPIDWDYIIKNKCLCWFWDDDESEKIVGILINVEKDEYTPFYYMANIISSTAAPSTKMK